MTDLRSERDSFGTIDVPKDRYWGAQTQRALDVFQVSDERFPVALIRAFALQKIAAVRANLQSGVIAPEIAAPIEAAALELQQGRFDDHFPLPIWQTGSGTQTNMNANEVIANRANEMLGQPLGTKSPVHPNDHVNCSQSSNDSFPTVMHIATALELRSALLPALQMLRDELRAKADAFADVVKIGRTHLMDAVPMTMGQAFDAFARQIDHATDRIEAVFPRLLMLPQGGTAVGSGLNTPKGFDRVFCEQLNALTAVAFVPNPSKFEGMGAHDALVEVSGALNGLAVTLLKVANDIRFLGSGPRCGLGELVVPHDGLTSSIMPGKRNPTIAEMLAQVCFQVTGNNAVVTAASASGHFELNVAKPVIIYNVLQSIRILSDGINVFATRMIRDLDVDRRQIALNVANAPLLATALSPMIGYDKVAMITAMALDDAITPREAAIALGMLSGEEYDRYVDPKRMAGI